MVHVKVTSIGREMSASKDVRRQDLPYIAYTRTTEAAGGGESTFGSRVQTSLLRWECFVAHMHRRPKRSGRK